MSRWSFQAPTAGQHPSKHASDLTWACGLQSGLLQQHLRRRSWAVCGAMGSLPGHSISRCSSNSSNCSNTTAAHTSTAVSAGTAPVLVHVLAPAAFTSSRGHQLDSTYPAQLSEQQHQLQQPQQPLLQQPRDVRPNTPSAAQNGTARNNGRGSSSSSSSAAEADKGSSRSKHLDKGTSSSSSVGHAEPMKYHITRCIKRCGCWQEVDVLVREYGPAFNIIHISAAITHLAQLSSNQSRQQHQLEQQQQQQQLLQEQDRQQVQGLGLITEQMARQHQQLQLSLGRQQQHPQQQHPQQQHSKEPRDQLLQQLLDQAVLRLQEAGSRQVANMMWSLAHMRYPWSSTPHAAAATLALADRAAELFDSAEGQHLANMAYAAAKLRLHVSQSWLLRMQDAWLRHVAQCCQQRSRPSSSSSSTSSNNGSGSSAGQAPTPPPAAVSPQATANLLWALINLEQQPDNWWLQQLVAGVAPDLVQWPANSVACFMWGSAKLGYKVQEPWSNGAAAATSTAEEEQRRQQQQQQQQQQQVQAQLLEALHLHSHSFTFQDMSQALWGAAEMRLQLPGPLLQQLLAGGNHHLEPSQQDQQQRGAITCSTNTNSSSSGSSSSSSSSNSSSRDGVIPWPFTAHSVSLVLYSLTRLSVLPQQQLPPLLLRPLLAALLASCPSADSHSLASAAWALCRLRLVGSCPLLVKAMLEAATQQIKQQQQQQSARLVLESGSVQQLVGPSMCGAEGAGYQPSAAAGTAVSSRAVATLLWAAAHCSSAAAAAAAAATLTAARTAQQGHGSKQQSARTNQQYLWQRQQQRLLLMLRGMHSTQTGSRTAAATHSAAAVPVPAGTKVAASDAIQTAALELLLTAAGMQQQQRGKMGLQQAPGPPVDQVLTVLPGASLWDMSQVLWAAGRLQLQLPDPWWQQCLGQLQEQLEQVQQQQGAAGPQQQEQQQQVGQSLAVSVWALGRAGVSAPPALMQVMQQASLPLLAAQQRQASLSPQGHVMLLLGLTRLCMAAAHCFPATRTQTHLRRRLKQGRMAKLRHTHSRHTHSASSSSSGDSGSSYAYHQQGITVEQQQQHGKQWGRVAPRKLSRRPQPRSLQQQQRQQHRWVMQAGLTPDWLRTFCSSAAAQLPGLPATGLVALLWGLGKLRYHPGSSFLAGAMQRVERLLPEFSARHIALLLWSLARLQHLPDEGLLAAIMATWEQRLASANKADSQQVHWVQQQLERLQRQRLQQL